MKEELKEKQVKSSLWHNIFKYSSDRTIIFDLLSSTPIFSELSKREIRQLQKIVQVREYLQGEAIFIQGDPGFSMFIIETGKVEITTTLSSGEKQQLAVLHQGDFFGELNVLTEGIRTASATAVKNSKVIVIFRPDLISIIEKDHSLGVKILFGFLKVLAEKIKNLHTDYMNLFELTTSESKTTKGG